MAVKGAPFVIFLCCPDAFIGGAFTVSAAVTLVPVFSVG
jgi:hypothetical protein